MTAEEKVDLLRVLFKARFWKQLKSYHLDADDLISECYLRGGFNAEKWEIACIRDCQDYFRTLNIPEFTNKDIDDSYIPEQWIEDFLNICLKNVIHKQWYLDYVFGGMTQEEIGRKDGISKAFVCCTLKDINNMLRKKL